jgi:predicted MFS family arabinose efflux permease
LSTHTSPASTERPFPWIGLLTLAGAIFVSVTSEFLPTGLLPEISRDLDVSIAKTGLLVTIFAATVVVATTPIAALTRTLSRKLLVVVVLSVIALSNVIAALAPSYEILVGARVLGGLAHGLFWAVVAAYSAHLVPKHQLGRAVAITAGGGSAAFVLGVPVGTALGHALGWRVAFFIIAGVVALLAVTVIRFLPPVDHRVPLSTGEIAIPLGRDKSLPGVIIVCLVIGIVLTGQNTFYTYIAPWLIDSAGFGEDTIPLMLFLFGGAGVIGLVLGGIASDRFPKRGFVAAMLTVIVSVLVLALLTENTVVVVIAFVIWGAAFGGVPAMMQTRMLRTASPRLRDFAAALQTTAFNLGIGAGALFGALLLEGIGLDALPWVALLLMAVGLLLSVGAYARRATIDRRSAVLRDARIRGGAGAV